MGGCGSSEYDDDYYYRDRRYYRGHGPTVVRRVPVGPSVVRGTPGMVPMGTMGGPVVQPTTLGSRPMMYDGFNDDVFDRRYRY